VRRNSGTGNILGVASVLHADSFVVSVHSFVTFRSSC